MTGAAATEPPEAPPTPGGVRQWWPWVATIFFLLWQVDFQFAYGFAADPIQKELGLNSFESSMVAAVYLVTYGLMQVPAGLMVDRYGVAWLLPLMGALGAGSVLLFANAHSYEDLVIARLLGGVFMAFVFPCAGKIARIRLAPGHFVLAMAIADMCFGLGAVLAGGFSNVFSHVPWRELMSTHGFVGLGLAGLLAVSLWGIRNPSVPAPQSPLPALVGALRNRNILFGIGIYVWGAGLTFGFGGYWNLKLQESCGCTAPQVSDLSTGLFAGLALGMLLAGLLGGSAERRSLILRFASVGALLLLGATLWLSGSVSVPFMLPFMFGLGVCLGSCSLSFGVAISGLPLGQSGTVVALVNAGGCLSGAFFQELPIWFGGGTASVFTVSAVYLSVAVFGVVLTWLLPREGNEG